MIESWEQHNDKFVRPHRVQINPYDPEKHVWLVDDGAHMVYKFTNDGKKLVQSWGEFKVAGQRRQALRTADRGRLAARRQFLRERRLHQHPRGEVRQEREVRPGLGREGHSAQRDAPGLLQHRSRDRDRQEPTGLRGRSSQLADPDLRRERQVPRGLAEQSCGPTRSCWPRTRTSGWPTAPRRSSAKFNPDGKLLFSWGTFGAFPGGFWGVHQFSVDSEGSLVHGRRPCRPPAEVRAEEGRQSGEPHRPVLPGGQALGSGRNVACRAAPIEWARPRPGDSGERRPE